MSESKPDETPQTEMPKCGIVMPISSIEGLPAEHWSEILSILKDVISSLDFEPNLVSDADDSGIIQKRIIQNLYNNEIIVCDVSCKNPNVMFELGMRLAFDKPTIIIKDDKTDYSFDTSVIEHLSYPRDLRFSKIIDFKENLKKKIASTFQKSMSDKNYSTFLKNFGQYKVARLEEKEVTSNEFLLAAVRDIIKEEVSKFKIQNNIFTRSSNVPPAISVAIIRVIRAAVGAYQRTVKKDLHDFSGDDINTILKILKRDAFVDNTFDDDHLEPLVRESIQLEMNEGKNS